MVMADLAPPFFEESDLWFVKEAMLRRKEVEVALDFKQQADVQHLFAKYDTIYKAWQKFFPNQLPQPNNLLSKPYP